MPVTLLLVFGANDGLLILADGRTTTTPAGDADPYASCDTARKTAVAKTGAVVAMAAGRASFNEQVVADIFNVALAGEVAKVSAAGRTLTVSEAAHACFITLQARNLTHEQEGRGVLAVIVGYDDETQGPQVWEFTVPDTGNGPHSSQRFREDGMLAVPCTADAAHVVRTEFGFVSPDRLNELLDEHGDDDTSPDFYDHYTLTNQSLVDVKAAVVAAMARLTESDAPAFDVSGVGGVWVMHEVAEGRPIETTRHRWGPMRVGGGGCGEPSFK